EHNGEIYNYKQIRRKLLKHHKFDTLTDSEVIVHLLEDHFAKSVRTPLSLQLRTKQQEKYRRI
ncbi:MAG: hypothetical protein WA461_08390, partial [Nitrososphaeraceae archaeon]